MAGGGAGRDRGHHPLAVGAVAGECGILQNLELGHDPVLGEQESFPEKVKQIMGELPRKRAAHFCTNPVTGTQAGLHGGLDT